MAQVFHPSSVVLTVAGKEVKGYDPDDIYFRHKTMTEREILMEMHKELARNENIIFSSLGKHLSEAYLYGYPGQYFRDYNVEVGNLPYGNRNVLSFSDSKIYRDVNGYMVMSFVVNAEQLLEISDLLFMELDYANYDFFRYLSNLPSKGYFRFRFVFQKGRESQVLLSISISNGAFKFSYHTYGPVCEDEESLNMVRHFSRLSKNDVGVYEISKEGSEGEEKIALVVSKHYCISKIIMRSKSLTSLMLGDKWSSSEILMAEMAGKKDEVWLDKQYALPLLSLPDASFEIIRYLPLQLKSL